MYAVAQQVAAVSAACVLVSTACALAASLLSWRLHLITILHTLILRSRHTCYGTHVR